MWIFWSYQINKAEKNAKISKKLLRAFAMIWSETKLKAVKRISS